MPDSGGRGMPIGPPPARLNSRRSIHAPALATALQEPPGLTLEAAKGSVAIIVIDSIDQPTED